MKVGRRHHAAPRRTPPQNRRVVGVPGENTEPVGEQQALRTQVSADRQQPVGSGIARVGKGKFAGEAVDRHTEGCRTAVCPDTRRGLGSVQRSVEPVQDLRRGERRGRRDGRLGWSGRRDRPRRGALTECKAQCQQDSQNGSSLFHVRVSHAARNGDTTEGPPCVQRVGRDERLGLKFPRQERRCSVISVQTGIQAEAIPVLDAAVPNGLFTSRPSTFRHPTTSSGTWGIGGGGNECGCELGHSPKVKRCTHLNAGGNFSHDGIGSGERGRMEICCPPHRPRPGGNAESGWQGTLTPRRRTDGYQDRTGR